MTFNPLDGYHGSFSRGEATGALGAVPGANFRGQASFMEAADRAQNHIRNAGKRAELAALTGQPQQQSSPRPNPLTGALSNVLGGVIKGFGQMGSSGGGVGGFSAGDANVMGMPMDQAQHIGSGGFTETVIDGSGIGPTTFGRW